MLLMAYDVHHKKSVMILIDHSFQSWEAPRTPIAEPRSRDGGEKCSRCGTVNLLHTVNHRMMVRPCRECGGEPMLSLKAGTIMEDSNLEDHVWAIDFCPLAAFLNGLVSTQPHRVPGIGHKAAWFVPHRLRAVFNSEPRSFPGQVDADETDISGGLKTIPNRVRKELSERSPPSKMAGVVTKCHGTNQTVAEAIQSTDYEDVQSFVKDLADQPATACTADAIAYETPPHEYDSASEYMRGQALANSVRSF